MLKLERIAKKKDLDKIEAIIKKLVEMNKGAIIIFLKNYKSFERLRQNKRLFEIENTDTLTILENISSIDGAIICDYQGNCMAYGAILDGISKKEANLQRGSRFNSAKTFVCGEEGATAIVISDDGMIDVLV